MEVIDVGAVPAEDMVDLLLVERNLRSLIGWHGAACFVLVRPITAPDFYRRLIENSDTIDATTRQHVAFIVFYGDRSGIVQRSGTDYHPYLARHRLQGLSTSNDGIVELDGNVLPQSNQPSVAIMPEPPPSFPWSTGFNPTVQPRFEPQLAERIRYSPETLNFPTLSQHMTRAATRLMEHYRCRNKSRDIQTFQLNNCPIRIG